MSKTTTTKTKQVGTIQLVKVAALAFCDLVNYREDGAKSHAPRAKKPTDEQIALAHVYDGMLRHFNETGQPWSDEYPIAVATWAQIQEYNLLNSGELHKWRKSIDPETDARGLVQWEAKPQFVPAEGNCRVLTALEIMQEHGKDVGELLIPVRVLDFVSPADFLSFQVRSNEERETGVVQTTFRDKLASAFRSQEYGMTTTRSDIVRTLGVKPGIAQKIRACLRLASAFPSAKMKERMLAPIPAKADDRKYSPDGYIPAQSIKPDRLDDLTREIADLRQDSLKVDPETESGKQFHASLNALVKDQLPRVEQFLEGLIDGSTRSLSVNDKGVWESAWGNAPDGAPIRTLMREHLNGEKFAVSKRKFGVMLSDPRAVEKYTLGANILAEQEQEQAS